METLTIAEKIKVLAARHGMSISDIARALDKSPSNLLNQLKRDDFRISDLVKIADILGVKFIYDFEEIEK